MLINIWSFFSFIVGLLLLVVKNVEFERAEKKGGGGVGMDL